MSKKIRVLRGGSYFSFTRTLRASYCYWVVPRGRDWNVGFRVIIKRRTRKPIGEVLTLA